MEPRLDVRNRNRNSVGCPGQIFSPLTSDCAHLRIFPVSNKSNVKTMLGIFPNGFLEPAMYRL